MTPKAVYDTNIIISAALSPSGIPSSLLVLAFYRTVQLYISPVILEEYAEVLHRPKFAFSEQVITGVLRIYCVSTARKGFIAFIHRIV